MHFLDNELLQVIEDVSEVLGLAATPGRYVLEDRLRAEIELYNLRHVAVHRLVVRDAGTHSVCERYVSGLIGRHQTWNPQRGIGPEGERIEKVIIDAPVYYVDPLGSLRGSHVDELIHHEQIPAFDQLDAELVGEKGVFVIG